MSVLLTVQYREILAYMLIPYTHCINSLGLLFVPVVHSMVRHLGDYLPSRTEMCIPHMFEVLAVKSSQLSLSQELAFS